MLTQHSANSTYDLAQQLSNLGLRLSVIDESPLTALLNACISPSMRDGQATSVANDQTVSVTNFIGASRLKGPEGASEHDLVMDELVGTIAGTVSRNLAWARNEVAPMVSSIYDEAMKAVAHASSRGPIPLVVVPHFYGALWDRPEISEMAARYSNTPLQLVRLVHQVKLPEGKSAAEVISTGLAGVDSAVSELINRRGVEFIQEVYECVFGEHRLSSLEFSMRWDSLDFALVTLLLTNALYNHVPDGLNTSLDGYKGYMADILSQSGAAVARVLGRRDDHSSVRRLVLELPGGSPRRGNIVVNGEIYNVWLQDGGSPEVLMGAVLAGRSDDYATLLAEKEANLKTYEALSASLKTELQYLKYNALLASFRGSVTQIINSLPEDELSVPRSILHQNLAFRLTHVKMSDVENPYIAARKVLCRTMWHHTDVERYLAAIDAAAQNHPGMDVREVALFAALDVVVEWLQSQVAVTSGG